MEEHPKKDIRDIITGLTHPVSITAGNRNILAKSDTEPSKTDLFTIFNKSEGDMVLCKNFELEEIRDSCTQTSKTILQLAKIETGDMSPDSLSNSPRGYQDEAVEVNHNVSYNTDSSDSEETTYSKDIPYDNKETQRGFGVEPLQLDLVESDSTRTPSLIETFLRKNKVKGCKGDMKCSVTKGFESKSCVETCFSVDSGHPQYTKFTTRNTDAPVECEKSFMLPTLASTQKNILPEVRRVTTLLSPIRRGRSTSPKGRSNRLRIKIPYIDQSESDFSTCKDTANAPKNDGLLPRVPLANRQVSIKKILTPNPPNSFSKDMLRIDQMSLTLAPTENNSAICLSDPNGTVENNISGALTRMQDNEWSMALRGLAEIIELCKSTDIMVMMSHMVTINQRLIQLLKSPRSHVCRTACQAAGHLFESMKDTRGPEFNDIVDILLAKTADANKFIRKDANLALDCMVTHVPSSHAIKALCSKGPTHKNNLVRSATVRLLICSVVIAGPGVILNPNNNEATRKRIFTNLVKFLEDKNADTRKYGERLYKVLSKEPYFDKYIKKYIDRDDLSRMKKTLKALSKK